MKITIALAGNPNSGKTTLFNALTGSNQYVGNWPGVTVEKKEGKLKDNDDVSVVDLPGIYSLSPYTLEEVVSRNYLVGERPDVILNLVDGTNLERNLYLTTQLSELGIPVVVAINMMDVVRKRGDKIDIEGLSKALGSPVVEISALKGTGIAEAADAAIATASKGKKSPHHAFSGTVEHALAHIEEACLHNLPSEQQRWYAIKIFERDEKLLEEFSLPKDLLSHIEEDIVSAERELDDDAESIITNERYNYVANLLKGVYKKKNAGGLTPSEKIDKVLTNRFAALPIFAAIMFIVYFISVTTVGTWVTDFTNDGLFGDGWYFFGIGRDKYDAAVESYVEENGVMDKVAYYVDEAEKLGEIKGASEIRDAVEANDSGALGEALGSYGAQIKTAEVGEDGSTVTLDVWYEAVMENAPKNEDFGAWIPGVGVAADAGLRAIGCWEWMRGLVVDGIIAGVGAVLGFVPQILVLFLFLAFLEACGYMSRIAFVMDRIFRKLGLSGKSFIPMLIGVGCSVPGIMASRTIENERDRRMTIMTTSFIPCGAKIPIIALIAGSLFGGAWWVAPSAYFIGMAAVVVSGIMLKKTKRFAGEPSPFVMELPEYHMPTASGVLRATWERGWSFIKKAGTVILLSTIVIWLASHFGFVNGRYVFDPEMVLTDSILGGIGAAIGWIFIPLGFGGLETAVATVMGLVAKEEVVAVLSVLEFIDMTKLAGFSFLVFNLLCAPCFATMGAIRREMNSGRWTLFAIGYQCALAYATSFCIYQIGSFFLALEYGTLTAGPVIGTLISLGIIAFVGYMLFRPYKEATKLDSKVLSR
ncbi:MAG: ferrous iron transporter B [Clostridia bacterium]|nr:ferrous iron transporter B [Clostridia bacterium]